MPGRAKDMTGQRCGALLVKSRAPNRPPHAAWLCECDCGNKLEIVGYALRQGQRSCGCLQREEATSRMTTHGMRKTLVYGVWNQMVQRCTNPNANSFECYGGRGITVCDRWRKFENFFADMGEPPKGHSIERRDNDGNYEPSNCYWIPKGKQSQNRSVTVHIEMDGERICAAEAARRLGVKYKTVLWRINRGWPTERIIGTPA